MVKRGKPCHTESMKRFDPKILSGSIVNLTRDFPSVWDELILQRAGLTCGSPETPQVYVASNESWTEIIVRYLIGASARRKWKRELSLRITEAINLQAYRNKIIPVYPRQQIQFLDEHGVPRSGESVSAFHTEVQS